MKDIQTDNPEIFFEELYKLSHLYSNKNDLEIRELLLFHSKNIDICLFAIATIKDGASIFDILLCIKNSFSLLNHKPSSLN